MQVFARTAPEQKELILQTLRERGMTTLMCGDGTNDVGALKAAHVGIALLAPRPPPGGQEKDKEASSSADSGWAYHAGSFASGLQGEGNAPASRSIRPVAGAMLHMLHYLLCSQMMQRCHANVLASPVLTLEIYAGTDAGGRGGTGRGTPGARGRGKGRKGDLALAGR